MLVSFCVIAYNEEKAIRDLIENIKEQDYPHNLMEIILVDSNSTDNTKSIMKEFECENTDFMRVCVLDNPQKNQPCGWNIALKETRGDIILRIDAHAIIPSDFVNKNVRYIQNGDKICGGRRISIIDQNNLWKRTLLIAESSMFGSGIALYRRGTKKSYVNTIAHAAYSKEVFQTVGGFNESLIRTEDNEIHYRMRRAGYKICFYPDIVSYYHARNTLPKMLKQKFLNGYWIGLTLGISPFCLSLYHFAPFVFTVSLLIGLGLYLAGLNYPLILLMACYGLFALLNTVFSIVGKPFSILYLTLPFLFFMLHLCYGIGTMSGIIKMPFWRHKNKFLQTKAQHT